MANSWRFDKEVFKEKNLKFEKQHFFFKKAKKKIKKKNQELQSAVSGHISEESVYDDSMIPELPW